MEVNRNIESEDQIAPFERWGMKLTQNQKFEDEVGYFAFFARGDA
jgi:hypothetical protein